MLSPLQQSLALMLCPRIGAGSYWELVEHFGSLSTAFANDLSQFPRLNTCAAALYDLQRNGCSSALFERVSAEQEHAQREGIRLLHIDDPDYPPLLGQIRRAPPLLYVRGDISALSCPQMAIVGSRTPTATGKALAWRFASELATSGFTITSGLALGIDGEAHRGAIETGGRSIAVLGSGLNRCYPKKHVALAQSMCEQGGALISEFPLNTPPKPQHFPQRNRVVSGLSCGTLVVEAALKSGSLITARYALQQNRDVFAVPGSVRNEMARGCHAMIKSGAKLVECSADIVSELHGVLGYLRENLREAGGDTVTEAGVELTEDEKVVLDAVGFESTPLDLIADRSAMNIDVLTSILINLELKGVLENTGLGYIRA